MRTNVEEFIKNHKHINYCEVIIHRDGLIETIRPNHVGTLIRITGRTEDDIYEEMPISASPIWWLIDYTGCVAVWYQGYMLPNNVTDEQIASIKKLADSKIILNRVISSRF